MLEGRLRLAADRPLSVRLIGIEPLSLPAATVVAGVLAEAFDLAAFIDQPGQAWVSPDTLRQLGMQAGQQAQTRDGRRLPPFVLKPELAPGVVIVDIGHAQTLLQAPGQLSRLLLSTAPAPLPQQSLIR